MFHPGTERLIDYWRERRGDYDMPLRKAIDPSDFAGLLPQVFMLGRDGAGRYPFRLAGGFVLEAHQRDLREVNVLSLWAPADRGTLQVALERARTAPEPFVIRGEMRATDVPPVGVEVLFAPVAGPTGEVERFLGLYQPTALLHRLKGRAVEEMAILSLESPAHIEAPRLRLASLNGRLMA
jgi:hypothetical protein